MTKKPFADKPLMGKASKVGSDKMPLVRAAWLREPKTLSLFLGFVLAFQLLFSAFVWFGWSVFQTTTVEEQIERDTHLSEMMGLIIEDEMDLLANDAIRLAKFFEPMTIRGASLYEIGAMMGAGMTYMAQFDDYYSEIRLIDTHGQEDMRISNTDGQTKIIPKENLTNISDAAFFESASQLRPGEYMLVPDGFMGPNENGVYAPQVFGIAPIYQPGSGTLVGIIIITLDGRNIMFDLENTMASGGGKYFLTLANGRIIGSSDTVGNPKEGNETGVNFTDAHPEAWDFLSSDGSGAFEEGDIFYVGRKLEFVPGHAHASLKPLQSQTADSTQVDVTSLFAISTIKPLFLTEYVGAHPITSFMTYGGYSLVTMLFSFFLACGISQRSAERERLREREAFQRTLMDTMVDGLIAINVQGNILFANPMAEKVFGYEPGDLVGRNINDITPKEDLEGYRKTIKQFLETGKSDVYGRGPIERRGVHKKGHIIDMELAMEVGEYNGQIVIIGSFRDITQRKKERAEAEMLAKQVQVLAEHGNDVVFLRDAKGKLLYISPSVKRHLGYGPERFLGATKPLAMHPDDVKTIWEDWKKTVYEKKDMYRSRARLQHKNKNFFWFDVIAEPILDDKNNVTGVVTACRNIDDQIKAEEEQLLLGRIVEESPAEVYVFDSKTLKVLYANDQACKNLGYTLPELKKKTMTGIKVGPTVKEGKKHLQPLIDGKKQNVKVKAKQKRKDGSIYDFEATVHLSRTADKPVLVSIGEDVTEINKAHAEVRTTQERYKLLADNNNDIILHRTPEGKILYVTPSVERVQGFKVKEMVGSTTWKYVHPEDRKKIKEEWDENILKKRRGFLSLLRILKADGGYLWIEANHNPVKDEKGRVVSVITSSRDVTERIQAEEKIKLLTENADDIIVLCDKEGLFQYITPSIEKHLGFKAGKMLGKTPLDLMHPDEAEEGKKQWVENILNRGKPYSYETRLRTKEGDYIWFLAATVPVKNAKGKVTGAVHSCKNIHEQKLASQARKAAEKRYRMLVDNSNDIILHRTPEGEILYASPSVERFLGYKVEEIMGAPTWSFVHPEDAPDLKKTWKKNVLEKQRVFTTLVRMKHKKGEYRWFEGTYNLLRNNKGKVVSVVSSSRDVTERVEAEEKIRLLAENTGDIIFLRDCDSNVLYITPSSERITGFKISETLTRGKIPWDFLHPEDQKLAQKVWKEIIIERGEAFEGEVRLLHNDGNYHWYLASTSPITDKHGKVTGAVTVCHNIHEQKMASQAREEAEKRFRMLIDYSNDIILHRDRKGNVIYISPSVQRHLGYQPEEFAGKVVWDLVHPDERENVKREWQETLIRKGQTYSSRTRFKAKNGKYVWLDNVTEPVKDEKGKVIYSVTTSRNIDEQLKAENEKTRLGAIIEDTLNEIYVFDADSMKFDFVNRGARENLGYSLEQLQQMTPIDIKPKYTLESFVQLLKPLRKGDIDRLSFETVQLRKDGSTYDVTVYMHLSHVGEKPVFVAITEDVTEQRKAAEQLRQSQKMEAAGQLTGGVAHDFNNLLTAIQGGLQLLEMTTELDESAKECVDLAVRSSKRGAELTRRLLAFSRTQQLNAKIVDLNTLLTEILPLLKRTIKESVEIEIHPISSSASIKIDVNEMENAILNLAINARDAMPGGGKLSFKTGETVVGSGQAKAMDVEPGPYIVLEVSDTGTGIPDNVVKKIFDPFFTTKEVGKGTGLGLSTIYGFVKQSGGHIEVDTKPGKGTTFRIYLPKFEEEIETADEKATIPDISIKETGTILLVEDEEEVRNFVSRALKVKGYDVLTAENGPEAMKIINRKPHIDLLLTDIIMPKGMDGWEVAREFNKVYPKAKILYSSGYAGKTLTETGQIPKGIEMLSKPYDPSELFERVSTLLKG